jgi:hypothetical protein
MGDGSAETTQKDGFIAARKAELAQAIAAESGLAPDDSAALAHLLKLLGALLHHEAHERLETLKTLYDPLDPDAPLARRDVSVAAFERFETALVDSLTRANFTEIDPDTVQTRAATKVLTGLAIKPSSAGIRRMRYFARGARAERIERKEWMGLRKHVIDAEVMNDVVVLVGFKADSEIQRDDAKLFAKMRRGIRPGAALVKSFRNVAAAELVTLHPGARPSMLRRDQFFLAAPAIVAGTPVLLNLWPALTVIFAVLAAYFGAQGAIDDNELKRALAAVSGLIAVGAFVMRQRLKYEAQTLRYQKQLADTVYFRNLANNAGVLDLLIGAGEEQDAKEAFLAYWTLLRSPTPLTKAEIDSAAETFLHERMNQRVDFDIQDALAKLERLGLVTTDGERHSAIAPADALTKLDAAWDAVFDYPPRQA